MTKSFFIKLKSQWDQWDITYTHHNGWNFLKNDNTTCWLACWTNANYTINWNIVQTPHKMFAESTKIACILTLCMHTWIEMLYYSVCVCVCIKRHVHICASKEMEKNADGNIVRNSLNWAKSFDCSSSIEGINNLWCSHAVEHYTWMKTSDYWYLQKPRWIMHIWLWVKEVTYKRIHTEDVNIYCYKTGKLVYSDKGHNSDYFPVGR